MISSSINSLVNFKTINFRNIDELHSSPNLSKLFVEYKKDFKSRLNAWMNKLSLTQPMNFDLTIKFINDSFYNEHFLILNGERIEADIAYQSIFKLAKSSIYIIDDYIDIKTLELLSPKKIFLLIISDIIIAIKEYIVFERP